MMDMGTGLVAVTIGFNAFGPAQTEALTGDEVRWTNSGARVHTVTAADGAFDSGRLPVGTRFARSFEAPGTVRYLCTLHPGMNGTLEVRRLLLEDAGPAGAPGRPRALHVRTALPAGAEVVLHADTGAGFAEVARTTADGSGGAHFGVSPTTTTAYRVVSGADASQTRTVVVLDREVVARSRRLGRRTEVTATVTPAAPGQQAVLQLRLPERFGWWPVARAKVAGDRVRFRIPTGRRLPARVVLVGRDGATVLAASPQVRVGRGEVVAQPQGGGGDDTHGGGHAGH